ncbi:metal-dependent phosphohydrolase [Pseudoduganella sp. SL102]|uniref:metal-dependent phosphohydrolase n=1 Tax=Pseudoduganella sp. SL102 TaxID=2995154 RepID=UPI00248B552C|nr:metal-dependent phosphohydrolase [Pseudoduganella sp. SL102]WBR99837.1 metal-dependent phosphohydrolase [Pseudoduganella sp. SL102]
MLPHERLSDLDEPDGAGHPGAPPSVLRALNAVQQRLEAIAAAPSHGDPADLRATARDLLHAVDLSADVALACVLRNQVAGSYAMRHSIETAVVAALVGRRLHMRPAHLLSLVSAALALHATGRHDQAVAQAVHCTRAGEPDWFACLLLDHAPDAGAGADVDAAAHLLRMADRYCAGISPRNYRRALLSDDALGRVLELSPDAELAAAFRDEIGPYPPGTVVRLASGEWGIVAHRDGGRPAVFCLRDAAGRTLTVPLPRRVGEDGCAIAAALDDEDSEIRVPMKQVWGPLGSL